MQYVCITTFCMYIRTHIKSVDNTRQYHGGLLYVIMAKQGQGVKYTMDDTLTSGLLKVFGSWYSNLLGKDFLPFFGWFSLFLTCEIPVVAPFVEDLPNTILSHSFNHDKSVLLVPYCQAATEGIEDDSINNTLYTQQSQDKKNSGDAKNSFLSLKTSIHYCWDKHVHTHIIAEKLSEVRWSILLHPQHLFHPGVWLLVSALSSIKVALCLAPKAIISIQPKAHAYICTYVPI